MPPVLSPSNRTADLARPVHIPESTWWQVDADIGSASLAAMTVARNYARGPMEIWRIRVARRTEADFIPWYTSFWTQEWLALKVSWYKANSQEGSDAAVKQLAAYLQQQYQERVLNPVAKEVDPDLVREYATKLYVQTLSERLQGIAQRYGIPQDQFDGRLKRIPAISLSPLPTYRSSLYQMLHAELPAGLPAYAAMMAQIRRNARSVESGPMNPWMSPVARRASEKLAARLAVSGGAGFAATVFGGIPGALISLGATGFGVAVGEHERPKIEALLRETLDAAVDDMWYGLMNDSAVGVMAGVHYLSGQITGNVFRTHARPIKFEPVPKEMPLSDGLFAGEKSDDEDQGKHERANE